MPSYHVDAGSWISRGSSLSAARGRFVGVPGLLGPWFSNTRRYSKICCPLFRGNGPTISETVGRLILCKICLELVYSSEAACQLGSEAACQLNSKLCVNWFEAACQLSFSS